jgi:hypothetical protein
MKWIFKPFLKWLGVAFTEDTVTPSQLKQHMATVDEKLLTLEANQQKERELLAETFLEITTRLSENTQRLAEQQAEIAALKASIEAGTVGENTLKILDRIINNSATNLADAQALADLIPNPPPVDPPADPAAPSEA